MSTRTKKHKPELALLVLGTVITVMCRNYAIDRREMLNIQDLSKWGGEIVPVIMLVIFYLSYKLKRS